MNVNYLKTAVLLAAMGGLMILLGSFFGQTGMIIGFGMAILTVGFSYWKSDQLALRSSGAVAVTEEQMPPYFEVVRDLAQRMDIPMPALYVSPEAQPNAFATGRNPKHAAVCVTQGILQVLDWEELRGVLAHELGHVKNRDILISSVAAAVATAIAFAANMAMWGAAFSGGDRGGRNPFALLLGAILAPIAAGLIQMSLSRNREYEADRTGALVIQDGEPLARALMKIEGYAQQVPMDVVPEQTGKFIINPLTGRHVSFQGLFRTHPSTADRVERLRSMRFPGGSGSIPSQ